MTEVICTHLGTEYSSKCRFCGEHVRVFRDCNGVPTEIFLPPINWDNRVLIDTDGSSYVLNPNFGKDKSE